MTVQKKIFEVANCDTKLEFANKLKMSIGYVCNTLNSEEDILMHTVKKWVDVLDFDSCSKSRVYATMIQNLGVDTEQLIIELKKATN